MNEIGENKAKITCFYLEGHVTLYFIAAVKYSRWLTMGDLIYN